MKNTRLLVAMGLILSCVNYTASAMEGDITVGTKSIKLTRNLTLPTNEKIQGITIYGADEAKSFLDEYVDGPWKNYYWVNNLPGIGKHRFAIEWELRHISKKPVGWICTTVNGIIVRKLIVIINIESGEFEDVVPIKKGYRNVKRCPKGFFHPHDLTCIKGHEALDDYEYPIVCNENFAPYAVIEDKHGITLEPLDLKVTMEEESDGEQATKRLRTDPSE